MAFDQNAVPKDLRPLNVARSIAEEPRIAPAASPARNPEGFFHDPAREAGISGSSGSIPVYYSVAGTVSDGGYVGLGYGNAVPPGMAMWTPRMPVPVGHPGISPAVAVCSGFAYNPNSVNRVVGNAADLASGAVATGTGYNLNLGNQVAGNGVDPAGSDLATGFVCHTNLGNRVTGNATDQTSGNAATGFGSNPNLSNQVVAGGADQASDEGRDDSASGKKVKLLCSFGGKILPRPSDSMLRYVGGQTRIISVRRDVSFNEFVQKMVDTYGQPVVIKYQLPDEDLDALVSISCPDDLDNMMDEYEKLVERSSDGSAKLRLFLFSASELDASGMVQFGDVHDNGMKYVDAVNGIMDGVVGGMTRKGSMASASSTQNSDLSGTEAVDSLGHGQVDVSLPSLTSMVSPGGNSTTSNDNALRFVSVDPSPAIYADASATLGIPMVQSGPLHTSSQPDVELERSKPASVSQPQLGLQQPEMDTPMSSPYMQAYVDHRPEIMRHGDYLQIPPQMGFTNPQLLGTSGSIYTQQQFRDNSAGGISHQFVPVVHMTMAPASSHVSIRQNMVQPVMQPQQTKLDHYAEESKFGPRIVHLPVEQSYNSYQVQVPSAVVGGAYGWHQVPVPEHVILSDGLASHQQVMFPEKTSRLDDCYMCQKGLPHAHSDTLLQDQRGSCASPMSDSNSIYHSLRLEDNLRGQPINRVVASGALGEGIIEQKVGAQPRALGRIDTHVGTPHSDTKGLVQSPEIQHENERTVLQKADDLEKPQIAAPLGVINRAGDRQSPYAAFAGTTPQTYQDDVVQQHSMPVQYQVKKDALVNNIDVPPGAAPIQISENVVNESPIEYSTKFPGIPAKEDTVDTFFSCEQLRPVDGTVGNLRVSPTETYNNEYGKSGLDNKPQQVAGKEVLLEIPHVHASRPMEPYEVAQPPIWVNPGAYPQPNIGVHNLDPEEIRYGNPLSSGVEARHLPERIPVPAEWKDDMSRFQPNMVAGDVEAVPLNSHTQSSLSPSGKPGDIQDSNSLFSNQDPWSLHHDNYFPPPRPNKVLPKKEALAARDPFGESRSGSGGEPNTEVQVEDGVQHPFSNQNKDFYLEHVRSSKGSAEEQIKQDLQAVAEGVAASVLHSATSSNPDLHDRSESALESNQDEDLQKSSIVPQHKAKVEDDIKNKLSDKTNRGFPVSDNIGRLQIILNSDLEEFRELGSGTFGTVFHGKWRGTDVAIKRINDRCFFQWWYFGVCSGSLTGVTFMSYVQENFGWVLGIAIPMLAMVTSVALFCAGSRTYMYKRDEAIYDKPFQGMVQALKATKAKFMGCATPLSSCKTDEAELELQEKPLCCEECDSIQALKENPDRNGEVVLGNVKIVLRLLPIWTMLLMFAVIFQQPATFFTKQGMTMRRNIGSDFKIPPATLQSVITLSIILLMPLYDKILIPIASLVTCDGKGISVMKRMGIGMFLSVIAMVIAAIVETKRLKMSRKMGNLESQSETVPLSIFWLLPQYILLGISDVFTVVGMQEFFYNEVPSRMRTMAFALYTSVFGVGSYLSALTISLVEVFTSSKGKQSWFSDNMNEACLDKYYWLLALLSALSLLLYIILCNCYKIRTELENENCK